MFVKYEQTLRWVAQGTGSCKSENKYENISQHHAKSEDDEIIMRWKWTSEPTRNIEIEGSW